MTHLIKQTPIEYFLSKKNRFQIEFPLNIDIQSWEVTDVKLPILIDNE